jgi:hypothetical protein
MIWSTYGGVLGVSPARQQTGISLLRASASEMPAPQGRGMPALQGEGDFELVDVSSYRADLARRREVKFVFSHPDIRALARILEGNGKRQVYNREVSCVRSVYFDDPGLSACRANLDGLGRRRKLRLRWYDRPLPGHECFLEIKWRENRVTGKHRMFLRSRDVLGNMPYKTLLAKLAAVLPERHLPTLWQYSEPTVLVEYQREHFASPDRRLRVTLDYGLVYYDQTGRQRISTSFGRPHEGLVVLEGKVPVGCDHELRPFLHPLSGRIARCSKYVYGCQMLGLIGE